MLSGKRILGIEFGSTRIKAVLIDENATVVSQGSYEWENQLVDGLWSYSLDEVEMGLQASYAALALDYKTKHGEDLTSVSAIGISGMMHGYLAFDKNDKLLVPFRTWRNTNAEKAADELTELLKFNIPMRWSVSQYYQAILNGEEHVKEVDFLTTLSGYVHYRLTGQKVLGADDASGMFPINGGNFDKDMLKKVNERLVTHGIHKPLEETFPKVLLAGENAGTLTTEGAKWLDPTGKLEAGCIMCPPEGDGGTGMVATNCIAAKTANISAGTSAFLMVVLEKNLEYYYKEIDVVATPHGAPVIMVHTNNFASEITAWANLFEEIVTLGGGQINRGELFNALYNKSLEADENCGGLMGYNFLAGEPIVAVPNGAPMLARIPDGNLTLANFMKMQIYSALGALAMGCELLAKEDLHIDNVYGHGGFFKTPFVGQSAMSAAIGAPVTVLENAGEGGAWGIAVLALFTCLGAKDLESFLDGIFGNVPKTTVSASEAEKKSFNTFIERYKNTIAIEKTLGQLLS